MNTHRFKLWPGLMLPIAVFLCGWMAFIALPAVAGEGSGLPALHRAAHEGDIDEVRRLLEQGEDVDSRTEGGRLDVAGLRQVLLERAWRAGRDVEIDVNALFEGEVVLGDRVRIGANCVLRNAVIGVDVEILDNCVIEEASVGAASKVGPFSRLRPGAELIGGAHIGNFVEIKKSEVGAGSKINHLSYIGDTTVGRDVNIGAGTITCNYDGANKHRTIIGDNAFIGSDTQLVAPVRLGDGAFVAAGSTVTKDVAPGALAVSRTPQRNIDGYFDRYRRARTEANQRANTSPRRET